MVHWSAQTKTQLNWIFQAIFFWFQSLRSKNSFNYHDLGVIHSTASFSCSRVADPVGINDINNTLLFEESDLHFYIPALIQAEIGKDFLSLSLKETSHSLLLLERYSIPWFFSLCHRNVEIRSNTGKKRWHCKPWILKKPKPINQISKKTQTKTNSFGS